MKESSNVLGFIGVGVMGEFMCANLIRSDKGKVHVYDVQPEPVGRLEEMGAIAAGSLKQLAQDTDIVFLSLPSISQVQEVCLGDGGLFSEGNSRIKFVVDMSTSDVARTRELALALQKQGVTLIDAPVARMREAARDGTLLITVGAEPDTFEMIKPYLETMGSDIVLCGQTGCGQVVKIMNNMIVFMTVQALAESLVIGKRAGVDPALMFDALTKGSADSFVLRNPGLKALSKDTFPEKTFPTEYAIKDIRLALTLAEDGKVDAKAAKLTHSLLEQTRDAGFVKEYYPVMVKLIEKGYA